MTSWQTVLHRGLFPLLSTDAVEAIRSALANDKPELIQGASCSPPGLLSNCDAECVGCCLASYGQWKALGLTTVNEVEAQFDKMCWEIDLALGESAACRWLINAFDDWSRAEMIQHLLPEFTAELERRELAEEIEHNNPQIVQV